MTGSMNSAGPIGFVECIKAGALVGEGMREREDVGTAVVAGDRFVLSHSRRGRRRLMSQEAVNGVGRPRRLAGVQRKPRCGKMQIAAWLSRLTRTVGARPRPGVAALPLRRNVQNRPVREAVKGPIHVGYPLWPALARGRMPGSE